MRTVVVLEDPFFIPFLKHYLIGQQNVLLIVNDEKPVRRLAREKGIKISVRKNITEKALFKELKLHFDDRSILCFSRKEQLKKCLDSILSVNKGIPVLVIEKGKEGLKKIKRYVKVFFISIEDLATQQFSSIWKKNENRKKIEKLIEINQEAENVLILVQNDPDPDALASGLALRVLLGRNKQTAPIGAFGVVTRSENLNMIKLLDMTITEVNPVSLKGFSKIAMVDVQPPYFKGLDIKADIVIDHHPCHEKYEADFSDVRVHYGAASTILAEYLIDGGCKITQRLATALIYGIKTDTMFLDRDISPADIKAFTYLYPMANLNMLRQIEHPTLEYSEISSFVKALKNVKIVESMLFAHLGRVEKEDIIPRIADFCLQIGGAEWSFVSGIFNENIVCCIRNVGYVKHAGEMAKRAFGDIGSAGGHRSMAKAVMPIKKFKEYFTISSMKEIEGKIIEVILDIRE
jgi:nanoRNase/pAp phosphatase (c-di-AMP/oligoRNAs hydrolase)